tara:strand:- start:1125 stop:1433 length:309 start_codon:yes stop_codon:yes gene_type:complete
MTECALGYARWVSIPDAARYYQGCNTMGRLSRCGYCDIAVCFHHRMVIIADVKKAKTSYVVCDACIASNENAADDVEASVNVVKALRLIHQGVMTKRAISSE